MSCNFQKWPHFPCLALALYVCMKKVHSFEMSKSKNASDERMVITTVNKTRWFSRKFLGSTTKTSALLHFYRFDKYWLTCVCVCVCVFTRHIQCCGCCWWCGCLSAIWVQGFISVCVVSLFHLLSFSVVRFTIAVAKYHKYVPRKHNSNCVLCVLSAHSLPSNWLNLTVQFCKHRHKKTTFSASSLILHSSL